MIDDQVKVIETLSRQVLFQCTVEEEAKAHQFAQDMEQLGVDVKVETPNIFQTLASKLGATDTDWKEYQQSMEQEIYEHD